MLTVSYTHLDVYKRQGFADYVNSDKVSFTWSMIDKITPRPDANVEKMLLDDVVEGLDPVITSKNTYVAPFVLSLIHI